MSFEIKSFTPAYPRNKQHLVLTREDGDKTLSKVTPSSSIEPHTVEAELYKYQGNEYCNPGVTIRRNLRTGAESRIQDYTYKIENSADAKLLGYGEYYYPNEIKAKWIKIKDCGTELSLIVKDGKIIKPESYNWKIGENLSDISPLTRKWLKQLIEYIGKVK